MTCPVGTYRNYTGAASIDDCTLCEPGYYCPDNASTSYTHSCSASYYCPRGSDKPRACEQGYYCEAAAPDHIVCPPSFYCPSMASQPTVCPPGHYCEMGGCNETVNENCTGSGAAIAFMCPLGYRDRYYGEVNNDRSSLDAACVKCESGKYGNHPLRQVCFDCEPGYVCLEGATYGNPDLYDSSTRENGTIILSFTVNGHPYNGNFSLDDYPFTGVGGNDTSNGFPNTLSFQCPVGYYCPIQSGVPLPCPAGTYNPNNRSGSINDCLPCPAGSFNNIAGMPSCQQCGASSTSVAGSSTCTCLGANRIFNPGNKECICQPLYEFRTGTTLVPQSVDGSQDCQRIVFNFCPENTWYNEHGDCLTMADWTTYCAGICPNGVSDPAQPFDISLGVCLCITQNLNTVCDASCQQSETSRQQIQCSDPPQYIVRDDLGNIVFETPTSALSSYDIGPASCQTLDGRLISTYLMQSTTTGLSGTYQVSLGALQQAGVVTNSQNRRRDSTSDQFGRRSLTVNTASIDNPVVCLKLNQVVLFTVTSTHYPQFDRNNLLNSQAVSHSN